MIEIAYIIIQIICAITPNVTSTSYPYLVHVLNAIATVLMIYVLITAKMSPCPPLVKNPLIGGILSSIVWILINSFSNFIFISLNTYFNEVSGRQGLLWSSIMTQCGMFSGAVLSYILTVHFNLFRSRSACAVNSC